MNAIKIDPVPFPKLNIPEDAGLSKNVSFLMNHISLLEVAWKSQENKIDIVFPLFKLRCGGAGFNYLC